MAKGNKGRGSGNGDNPFRSHGRGGGYAEYRYGPQRRSKVYVPGKTTSRNPSPLGDKAHREGLIGTVGAVMREWTETAFEHEAPVRHGLRQAWCEKGFGWQDCDDAAAYVVREALHNCGARRPSWEEGQRHHTTAREDCAWCGREIDDPSATSGQRYCSNECAKAAIVHRGGREGYLNDITVRAAYRLVAKNATEAKPCKHCGTPFKSNRKDAEYCSVRCVRHATGPILPHKDCPVCHASFKPERREQVFCSRRCAAVATMAEQREAMPAVICTTCETPFKPAVPGQHFCSDRCRKKVENLNQRLRKGNAQLTAFAFDQCLANPINASHPAWLTPERFDELVAA